MKALTNATIDMVMHAVLNRTSRQDLIEAADRIDAELRERLPDSERLKWLWCASKCQLQLGSYHLAGQAAREGLRLAERMRKSPLIAVFSLDLATALLKTPDWRPALPILEGVSTLLTKLKKSSRAAIAATLVETWVEVPSIADRTGLAASVLLLQKYIDHRHYSDVKAKREALKALATGMLQCRYDRGSGIEPSGAIAVALEALALCDENTKLHAGVLLTLANALVLGSVEETYGTLSAAKEMIERSLRIMSDLGYDDEGENGAASLLVIGRRLAALGYPLADAEFVAFYEPIIAAARARNNSISLGLHRPGGRTGAGGAVVDSAILRRGPEGWQDRCAVWLGSEHDLRIWI